MSTTVAMGERVRVIGGTLRISDDPARIFEIPVEPAIVGRDPGCEFCLNDSAVSSAHFEITATPKGTRVRDLGSRNGTFVNGHRCGEIHLLGAASIRCGDTELHYVPAEPIEVDVGESSPVGSLIGTSVAMKKLFQRLRKVAATDAPLPVLITGETGTGKELVARAVHSASPRAHRPFLVQDCTTLTAALAGSALFGHEAGSFTSAVKRHTSPFVEADGGTVFLDEIGDLPSDVQPMLLRAIEAGTIKPVGSNTWRKVDVRIVAATRRDLAAEVNKGSFRSDLYFRLKVLCLEVPPLRAHTEDIEQLSTHLARELGFGDAGGRLSIDSIQRLAAYDWPGNVRELRNVIAAACAFAAPDGPIEVADHLTPEETMRRATNFEAARREFERVYWQGMVSTLKTITAISEASGVARSTVRSYLEKYGLRCTE